MTLIDFRRLPVRIKTDAAIQLLKGAGRLDASTSGGVFWTNAYGRRVHVRSDFRATVSTIDIERMEDLK